MNAAATEWRSEIDSASRRLDGRNGHFLLETPLWKLPAAAFGLNSAPGVEIWLKLEHLQVGGSFKARGMMNRLLTHTIPASGVVVASGGNAGIATAAAAQALGVRCEVFLPGVSPEAKRAKLRALGAQVTVVGDMYAQALAACLARQAETGALLTHAYDQPEVVAGAGTLGREIEQQGGLPDAVLVSVGGGGLIGGAGGAVVGSVTGLGTTEGALIGGAAGAVIGDDNDRGDRRDRRRDRRRLGQPGVRRAHDAFRIRHPAQGRSPLYAPRRCLAWHGPAGHWLPDEGSPAALPH